MWPRDGAGSGADSTMRPNLRTCGGAVTSLVVAPKRGELPRSNTMPTIPSRFEVTLIKGDREHKGFGAKALRFDSGPPEEVPGPGSYGLHKAFHQESGERVSWGIRGTGGFASRSTRFGARSMPQMPPAGRGCPGPGAYDPTSALRFVKEPQDFNQAKRTAIFADAEAKSRVPASASVPGPGHYTCKTQADAKATSAAQAAFKSASGRGVDVGKAAEFPGPGEYYDGTSKPFADPIDDCGSAVFKHPTKPKIARVHRDLPTVDGAAREVLGSFADAVGRECVGTIGSAAKLPGPGHYDQDRDGMWHGGLVGAAGSSAFQAGPKRTEWASEEVALMPGPGRYNPKKVEGGVLVTSAASCFNSGTERNQINLSAAPGPAYYKPSLLKDKRSFRLRSTDRTWLS